MDLSEYYGLAQRSRGSGYISWSLLYLKLTLYNYINRTLSIYYIGQNVLSFCIIEICEKVQKSHDLYNTKLTNPFLQYLISKQLINY